MALLMAGNDANIMAAISCLFSVAVLAKINVHPPKHAIIELKFIPKERFTDNLLAEKVSEAKEQLAHYTKSQELMQIPDLLKFVVAFNGDEKITMQDCLTLRINFLNKFFITVSTRYDLYPGSEEVPKPEKAHRGIVNHQIVITQRFS